MGIKRTQNMEHVELKGRPKPQLMDGQVKRGISIQWNTTWQQTGINTDSCYNMHDP